MNFRQVIEKYGYPFIGKEVAECVYGARRYMEKLIKRENGAQGCGEIPNHSYMADLAGDWPQGGQGERALPELH